MYQLTSGLSGLGAARNIEDTIAARRKTTSIYQKKTTRLVKPVTVTATVKQGIVPSIKTVTAPVVSPIRSNVSAAPDNIPRPAKVSQEVWNTLTKTQKVFLAAHASQIKSSITSVNIVNPKAPLDSKIEPQAVTILPKTAVKPIVIASADPNIKSSVVTTPATNIEPTTYQAAPVTAPATVATMETTEAGGPGETNWPLIIAIGIGAYFLLRKVG